ncbi:MAG: amidase [Myxococcales bacterium]
MSEPWELPAAEAAALLARGALSALELTRSCLSRIAAREPEVQAWEHLEPERALEQARRCDRTGRRGPLFGLPVGVKDLIDTRDLPTAYGTSLHRGHRPAADAACVAALQHNGGVILGKTVTTELAYFTPGKTRNPHDPARTPGGSSSGSAAAVACGMVPAALGTQTAGSVIRPAAFCGVIGFKPSFGLFAREGIKPIAPSLDTLGVFARALGDLPLLCAALGAPLAVPPSVRAPRIAFFRTAVWESAEAGSRELLERSASRLAEAGAEVRELTLPPPFDGLVDVQKTVMAVEMAAQLAAERAAGEDQLGEPLRRLFREGDAAAGTAYAAAKAAGHRCREEFAQAIAPSDLLLTLAAPGEAPLGLSATGDPLFNRVWTLLHVPCLSLPAGRGAHGMPLAVQLVGARGSDAQLLAHAGWVSQALGAGT